MARWSFWVVALILVVAGGLLRLLPGENAAGQVKAAAPSTGQAETQADGQPTPAEQAVLELFTAFDEGRFADASGQAIEIQWEWREDGSLVAIGLKDRNGFIADSAQELGATGARISIFEITVDELDSSPAENRALEMDALRSLSSAPRADELVWVRATGTVKINCAIRGWEKQLAVMNMNGSWKVLLPPPDSAARSRMLGWFPQAGEIVYAR